MKLIKIISIATAFFVSHAIISMTAPLSPQNTIILSDLDDVLIQKNPWHKYNIVFGGMWQNIANSPWYLNSLSKIRKNYAKNAEGKKTDLHDEHGNAINGLTFHFLFHGMQDQNLASYVPWLVNTMEHSRCYIQGTKKIYDYLKYQKGYTIVFATNKDRISYDMTATAFGDTFTNLATKTFVAHPGNSQTTLEKLALFAEKSDTPVAYKNLVNQAINIQESHDIHHTPHTKPNTKYYTYVQQILGTDKNIIFIDDKKENIDGFNTLKNNTTTLHGIHFKNPQQLLQELIALNILTEEEGTILTQEIIPPKKTIRHAHACLIIAIALLFIGRNLIQ